MRQAGVRQDETGTRVAHVPSLIGCRAQGGRFENAVADVRNAMARRINAQNVRGEPVSADFGSIRVIPISTD